MKPTCAHARLAGRFNSPNAIVRHGCIDLLLCITAPFIVCLPKNGCMADFKADTDLIEKLKKGRTLAIQAFEKGKPISFTLPLTGLAQAYDGPASDPTGLNQSQEGLPNELQSHSEDHAPDGK